MSLSAPSSLRATIGLLRADRCTPSALAAFASAASPWSDTRAPWVAAIDPSVIDYAIAGPAFETASKPGYGPEIGRKGLAEIAAVARVPVLAIGGVNATRAAEVLSVGPAGIAVMGSVMGAADPRQEMKALLATVVAARR